MPKLQPADIFPVADDLNARYQGKRVRVSDKLGRVAVGTFTRCEEQRHTNGDRPLAILVDYETLHHHDRLALSGEDKNPVFPWALFYLDDEPTVEVMDDA